MGKFFAFLGGFASSLVGDGLFLLRHLMLWLVAIVLLVLAIGIVQLAELMGVDLVASITSIGAIQSINFMHDDTILAVSILTALLAVLSILFKAICQGVQSAKQ